jgi:hypothetical protein
MGSSLILAAFAAAIKEVFAVAADIFQRYARRVVGAPGEWIDQHFVWRVPAAAHIEEKEFLSGEAFAEEIASAALDGNLKRISVQQLAEAFRELSAAGEI